MSITYEEALSTLQAMFEEPWTRDSLDAVLRHQRGHMENTVDLILKHGQKDPQILIDQLDAGIDPEQSALQLDEQLARQLAAASLTPSISNRLPTNASDTNAATSTSNLIGTPTILPDDFLRIPNYTPPAALSSSGTSYSISDDEALARMLQDELFTEELRRNPDFAHLAGRRAATTTGSNSHRSIRQGAMAGGAAPSLQAIPNPFAGFASRFNQPNQQRSASQGNLNANNANNNNNIMEKLSEMGEGAKRRLQLMAAQFQQAQNNLRNNNTNADGSPSTATSLSNPNNASERRSLLFDDTDDMELAARKDL